MGFELSPSPLFLEVSVLEGQSQDQLQGASSTVLGLQADSAVAAFSGGRYRALPKVWGTLGPVGGPTP